MGPIVGSHVARNSRACAAGCAQDCALEHLHACSQTQTAHMSWVSNSLLPHYCRASGMCCWGASKRAH
eukprot:211278-Pelagomonas_calceolata.AAC.1